MELIKALVIVFGFSFFGNTMTNIFSLPIPGSIVGLLSLFIALQLKIVKLNSVKEVSNNLQKYMALYFVPLLVALSLQAKALEGQWLNLIIIILLTTTITYVTVGVISEKVAKHD